MVWAENPLYRRLSEFAQCYLAVEKYTFVIVDPLTYSVPDAEDYVNLNPLGLPDDEINDGLAALAEILDPSNGGQDPTIPIF